MYLHGYSGTEQARKDHIEREEEIKRLSSEMESAKKSTDRWTYISMFGGLSNIAGALIASNPLDDSYLLGLVGVTIFSMTKSTLDLTKSWRLGSERSKLLEVRV